MVSAVLLVSGLVSSRSKSAGARRFVASLAQALGAQRRDNGRRHMTNGSPLLLSHPDSSACRCGTPEAVRGASSRRPIYTSLALILPGTLPSSYYY